MAEWEAIFLDKQNHFCLKSHFISTSENDIFLELIPSCIIGRLNLLTKKYHVLIILREMFSSSKIKKKNGLDSLNNIGKLHVRILHLN